MLRKPSSPRKGKIESSIPEPALPRKDLTISAKGCRETYFTGLSTRSFDSIKSMEKRVLLNEFMVVKANPSKVTFEYELGKMYEQKLEIYNYSKRIQYVSLSNTLTKSFQLSRKSPLEEVAIAPGLDQTITVIFKAPMEYKVYQDQFDILLRNGTVITVPLIAYPPPCELDFDSEIDFGTMMVRDSDKPVIQTCKIMNRGSRAAELKIEWESNIVSIQNSEITILPGQEYNLDVQYAPNECGQLRTAIGIVVVNDVEPKALNIIVKGKVIENNVLLTTLKGNLNIYELEGIDFGSVSFGQRACIPVKIANQNQVTHQWSIKVDEKVGKDKRALSEVLYVEPAEGVLKPGQSNILKFYFNPKQVISNVGFTSLKTRTDSKEYTLPIQLSVTQESCPEVTKMLRLKGTGVPFELEWSKKTVEFETTQNGKESVQTFTISNPSPVAYSFKFQKIVQFKLSPSHGLLGPNETVTIAVAFKPNQLGLFQCYASCQFSVQTHFGDGKIEQEIELDESSSLKGQIQLIDYKNVYKSEPIQNKEWNRLLDHKKKYIEYIRSIREGKPRAAPHIKALEGSIDLVSQSDQELKRNTKADTFNGLLPPEPVYNSNRATDEIVKSENSKEQERIAIQANLEKLKEPVLHRAKFIDSTKLPQDWHQIQISKEELAHIHVSTNVVDFGEVTIHSENSVPLNFLNATNTKVPANISFSVSSATDAEAISTTCPFINLLFLGLGGVQVKFCPKAIGSLNATLTYTINKQYVFHIPVKAFVKPISLTCNVHQLDMYASFQNVLEDKSSFLDSSLCVSNGNDNSKRLAVKSGNQDALIPFATASFQLNNPGTSEAQFEIQNVENYMLLNSEIFKLSSGTIDGLFHVTPIKGKIPAKSSIVCKVIYVPGTKVITEKMIRVATFDPFASNKPLVHTLDVLLKGYGPNAEYSVATNTKQTHHDLGVTPVYLLDEKFGACNFYNSALTIYSKNYASKHALTGLKMFKLKNSGSVPICFVAFSLNRPNEIQVSHSTGLIKEGQSLEIAVTSRPVNEGVFEDIVVINVVGGGKPLRIPVKFEGKKPLVELSKLSKQLSEKVIIGSTDTEGYVLHNKGAVLARFIVDLTCLSEFSIQLREDRRGFSSRVRSGAATARSITSSASSSKSVEKSTDKIAILPQKSGKFVILDCGPGEKLFFDLVFQPKTVCDYDEKIPVFLLGIDKKELEIEMSLAVKGVASPIQLSQREVVFNSKIIPTDGSKRVEISKVVLEIFNTTTNIIRMSSYVVMTSGESDVFQIEAVKGTLDAQATQAIKIVFDPYRPGTFEGILNLDIAYDDQSSIISIPIKASAIYPSVVFQPAEIFLPIVPLGEETFAPFSIINVGCQVGDLVPIIPEEIRKMGGQVDLLFPEGNCIRNEDDILPCIVKFSCTRRKSISFTVRLPFEDGEKNRFYVTIHGTTESSVFSLQPYYLRNILKGMQREMIQAQKLKESKPMVTPGGVEVYTPQDLQAAENYYSRVGQTILLWFQDHLGVGQDENFQFPQSLTCSNGKYVENLLTSLIGKKLSALTPNLKLHGSEDDMIKSTYRHYHDLLVFLSSHGACLSFIKPEHLLSLADYKRFGQIIATGQDKKTMCKSLHLDQVEHKNFKEIYQLVSLEAWTHFLLQIIKVFMFPSRVIKKTKIKRLNDDKDQTNLSCGYTENLLLDWCSAQQLKQSGERSVKSFDTDFKDGIVIKSLILSFVSYMADSLKYIEPGKSVENATILKNVLLDLYGSNLFEFYKVERFFDGNTLDYVFLVMFLYQTLPSFMPKSTIEFVGNLHERLSRTIEITNASSKPMTYYASLIGDREYGVKDQIFTVSPKSHYQYQIEFISRFTRPSNALLIIKSKKMLIGSSSIMVFRLTSQINLAIPILVSKIEAPVYCCPPSIVRVEIKNPFEEQGNFKIQTSQQLKLNAKLFENEAAMKRFESSCPPSFTVQTETIQIPAKGTGILNIGYSSFHMGQQECTLMFSDPEVGEFTCKIEGTSTSPNSVEQLNWYSKTGSSFDKMLRIMPNNPLRDKSLNGYIQHSNHSSKELVQKSKGKVKVKAAIVERDSFLLPKTPLTYTVQYSSPFFKGPAEVILNKPKEELNRNTEGLYSELPLSFTSKVSGRYPCKITLSCREVPDIRVYHVTVMARSEGSRVDFEFHTEARRPILQEIPISNPTEEEWPLKVSVQGEYFHSPLSASVKPNSKINLPVLFKPLVPGQFQGQLIIHNLHTSQNHICVLNGFVTEPACEGTIEIQGAAREKQSISLMIHNTFSSEEKALFDVVTDLPLLSGDRTIRVDRGQTMPYECEIVPVHSGKRSHYIKFFCKQDGSYTWYRINLSIDPPAAEKTIRITGKVNSPITHKFEINSASTSKSVTYKVQIEGNGLTGNTELHVPASSVPTLELRYAPTIPGPSLGKVLLSNEETGEFWFMIDLFAEEPTPVELPIFSCELGSFVEKDIEVVNPTQDDLVIFAQLSNSTNFQINSSIVTTEPSDAQEFTLQPNQVTIFKIKFCPTAVGAHEKGTLTIGNERLGIMNYVLQGKGMVPATKEKHTVESSLSTFESATITFKNPLLEPTTLNMSLLQEGSDFRLISNSKFIVLNASEQATIQVLYEPQQMKRSRAQLELTCSQGYKWVHIIEGTPTLKANLPIQFKFKAREKSLQTQQVLLKQFERVNFNQGIMEGDIPLDTLFDLAVIGLDKKVPMDFSIVQAHEVSGEMAITLQCSSRLQVPLDAHFGIQITDKNGGAKWSFPVHIIVTPPAPDDTITIQAVHKKQGIVAFSLRNDYGKEIPYHAYFYRCSTTELSVSPSSGTLVPDTTKSTLDNRITVAYNPLGNGKSCSGLLIIETTEFCLYYEVRGVSPLKKK